MHEFSIAQSLIDLLTEQLADEPSARVSVVHLKIGDLSGVVPAALSSAFAIARQGTALEGAALKIESVAPRIWCEACDSEQLATSPQSMTCVVCRSPSADVRAGRELDVTQMEIVEESPDAV